MADSLAERVRQALGELLEMIEPGPKRQARLADAVGVSQATVSRVLNDEQAPSATLLEGLVRQGYRAHWLLTGQGPVHGAPDSADPGFRAGVEFMAQRIAATMAQLRREAATPSAPPLDSEAMSGVDTKRAAQVVQDFQEKIEGRPSQSRGPDRRSAQ